MIRTLFEHKILLVVVVIAVAGAVWFGMTQTSGTGSLVTTTAATSGSSGSSADAGGDTELVSTLLALRAVSLSGTIFSDAAFTTLRDLTTHVVMEPVGRANPFEPLSAGAAPTSGTTQEAQMFAPPTQAPAAGAGASKPAAPTVKTKSGTIPVPKYR